MRKHLSEEARRTKNQTATVARSEVFFNGLLAEQGYGQDWLYAGWYQTMLHETYPDRLPGGHVALLGSAGGFADQKLVLPPVGHGPATRNANSDMPG